MPTGHKADCECVVCKGTRAKEERFAGLPPVYTSYNVPVQTIPVGTKFRYQGSRYECKSQMGAGSIRCVNLETGDKETFKPGLQVFPDRSKQIAMSEEREAKRSNKKSPSDS